MTSIGIDLGTTNSVAAIDEGRGPRVLQTSFNESITPSVVSYRKGNLLVGRPAWNNSVLAPKDTIFSIKRLMGRSIDDPTVIQARKRYPYAIVAADDPNDPDVRVVINGIKYTPVDISAKILEQIVKDASKCLGKKITHAVITVPAYFTEPQRAATREAGEKTGLIIKKIIDEPTAAAIAFGVERPDEKHTILVFDLGGGTLDISLLKSANNQFVCTEKTGDMWLGGDDFDIEIVEVIKEWVNQKYNIDPTSEERFLMKACQEAENAKRYLTAQLDVDIIIPAIVKLSSGDFAEIDMTVSRSMFEKRIRPKVEKCKDLIERIMTKESLTPDNISKVLLIGGTTYVPMVRQVLVDLFGEEKVRQDIDPMNAVAMGAAILARSFDGVECPKCKEHNPYEAKKCKKCETSLSTARAVGKNLDLEETTALDLGIVAVDAKGKSEIFSVIIPAGTTYPLESPMSRTFFTTSHKIRIPVYEGVKNKVLSQNTYLGMVEYELPLSESPNTPVIVEFNYDRDRVLTVTVKVEEKPELCRETRLVRDTLFVPTSPEDTKWRDQLQNTIAAGKKMLEDYHEFITPDRQASLREEIRRAKQVLTEKDQTVGNEVLNRLLGVLSNLGIANCLFLAERTMFKVDPKNAELLAQAAKSLREAWKADDQKRVEEIKEALLLTFKQRSKRGPIDVDIQNFDGLLQERLLYEES